MNSSRRFFVRAAGMFGLAALTPGVMSSIAFGQNSGGPGAKATPTQRPPGSPSSDPFAGLTSSRFYSNIGSNFRFSRPTSTGGAVIDMKLIGVESLRPSVGTGGNGGLKECFALKFEGPFRTRYRQSMFNVDHSELGKFQVFIVPTGVMSRWGWTYIATVNRIKP